MALLTRTAKRSSIATRAWTNSRRRHGQTNCVKSLSSIAHAIEVAGPHRVGLGPDRGLGVPAPVGVGDVTKLEAITCELPARSFDENTVRKLLGEKTLRVMREAERVAARLADKR